MGIKLTKSRGYNPMRQRPIAGGVINPQAALKGRGYNVFALPTYDEVERLGLSRYFAREAWEAGRSRLSGAA